MTVAPTVAAPLSRAALGLPSATAPALANAPALAKAPDLATASTAAAALAVAPSSSDAVAARKFSMAQFNVYNLFDTVDDANTRDNVLSPAQYETKLTKLSMAIRENLGAADVITLQEVENQRVLDDLLARPEMQQLGYKSVLMDGNDKRGINVAMLYRDDVIDIRNVEQVNPVASSALPDSGGGQKDPSLLFARPPLVVDFTWNGGGGAVDAAAGAQNLTVIVNHFKSKLGKPGLSDTRREGQSAAVGGIVDARRAADPFAHVIVAGDLNLTPTEASYERLITGTDGKQRVFNVPDALKAKDRYSYDYRGKRQLLDHLMVTPELSKAVDTVSIPHFNTKWNKANQSNPTIATNVSDHDPIIATFDFSKLAPRQAAEGAAALAIFPSD